MVFGNALQRARIAWLHKLSRPRRVLIVGEGNGCFLSALLDKFPEAQVDCVDASAQMLHLAHQRLVQRKPAAEGQVRFFCDDILHWEADSAGYDLVVTHFVLDCFRRHDLVTVVDKIAGLAAPQAVWLLADFHVSQGALARAHAHIWLAAMYLFFRLTTGIKARHLVSPTPLLKGQAFYRIHRRHWWGGLIKSEVWRRSA